MEKSTGAGEQSYLRRRPLIKRLFQAREIGVLGALIVLAIIMSFASPYFLKTTNIFNVLRGMSTIGIMSIGMTMVIITGGIDLSVGSLLAVSGMFCARLMYSGLPPPAIPSGGIWDRDRPRRSEWAGHYQSEGHPLHYHPGYVEYRQGIDLSIGHRTEGSGGQQCPDAK